MFTRRRAEESLIVEELHKVETEIDAAEDRLGSTGRKRREVTGGHRTVAGVASTTHGAVYGIPLLVEKAACD